MCIYVHLVVCVIHSTTRSSASDAAAEAFRWTLSSSFGIDLLSAISATTTAAAAADVELFALS